MAKVLYCHDDQDLADTRKEILERIYCHEVVTCTNARASLERVKRGMATFDVAIVHKDLGLGIEPIGSGDVIAEIQKTAPNVRIGVQSGEFRHGYNHVVYELKADFYFPVTDDKWYIEQINRGLVSPEEMNRRGKEVAMP